MTSIDVQESYRFGRFVLEPDRRSLRGDAGSVPLGARAFDILLMLVRNHDRVVSKDEILAAVWRGMAVEENNLAVHVSALRRALGEKPGGDRFIATVSGLGYRFVGSVTKAGQDVVLQTESTPGEPLAWAIPVSPPVRPHPLRTVRIGAAVLVLAMVVAIAWAALPGKSVKLGAPRLSIAVLPFRSLGDDGRSDYIADAVTDDLTSDLSHIPSSIVIARDSADTFRGRDLSAPSIGRALNVRYLLEGSLFGDGRNLHVNAQLVDAAAGTQLWASVFDVDRSDLASGLTEIVRRISAGLRYTLVQAEETRFRLQPPANPDALDLTLRARSILDRSNTFSGVLTAQHLLERAVEVAPDDSNALAELGLVLVHKAGDFADEDEIADHEQAISVIDKAVRQAPHDPLAITANGMMAWLDYRCRDAQASFWTALSLDPNDLDARNGLALCARELGNMDEMIAQIREILRLDPIGSRNAESENSIGMGYLFLGKPREAIDWLVRAADDASGDDQGASSGSGWPDWNRTFLIAATEMSGDTAGAARQYHEFAQQRPHRTVFQLAVSFSQALCQLKGYRGYLDALRAAGMPVYAGEFDDFKVAPASSPRLAGDFDPTPLSIPGGRRIDTVTTHLLLSTGPRPLVVDVSGGARVIPGAVWVSLDDLTADLDRTLRDDGSGLPLSPERTIITMSYGPFGWYSYNAALYFINHGFHHVLWYRGGEAAWASAGYPTQDRRSF